MKKIILLCMTFAAVFVACNDGGGTDYSKTMLDRSELGDVAVGTLTVHNSGIINDEWGPTQTIEVTRTSPNDGKIWGVTIGQSNEDGTFKCEKISAGADYRIDITMTTYSDREYPIPDFYHVIIDIKNASGCDSNLQILGQNSAFDINHYRFNYNGHTYGADDKSYVLINDYGPTPDPAYVTREIHVDFDDTYTLDIWINDGDTSRTVKSEDGRNSVTFVNCYNFVHQPMPHISAHFDKDATNTYHRNSDGTVDLCSITLAW
jgi:hypothetical protein